MPHSVEEAVEHVQEKMADVAWVEDILSWRWDVTARFAFEGKTAAPDNIDENEEDDPARESSSTTIESTPVKECTETESTKDLEKPTN